VSQHPDLHDQQLAAAVAVAAPALVALAWPTGGPPSRIILPLLLGAALISAIGTLWRSARSEGLALLLVGALGCLLASALQRPHEPESGLFNMVGVGFLLVHAFGWVAPRRVELAHPRPRRWSGPVALSLLLSSAALRVAHGVPAAGQVVVLSAILLLASVIADYRRELLSRRTAALTWLAGALAAGFTLTPGLAGPQWGALVAVPVLVGALSSRIGGRSLVDLVVASPARLLVVSFATICLIGALLLALGPSGAEQPVSLMDAAFTSVSATCVTGLSVVDTGSYLSPFGQVVVLLLIQVGGLGIMTFAAAASVWTGRRMSVREEATAADLLGPDARKDLAGALAVVLKVTLLTEAVTAFALSLVFLGHGDPGHLAAWRGVFTAISAFCNAGFALQPDSLVPYQGDPFVLGTVGLAIVVGGLGPAVVVSLPRVLRGGGTLHARLVLVTTLVLIAAPSLVYAVLEWDASLAHLGPVDKLTNAVFQAITPRTAGFNSVDLSKIEPATWTLVVILMFIGGSPASTAGGIKTTTLAVVVLAGAAAIRGREDTVAGGRRLPFRTVMEAGAIASFGVACVLFGLVAVQLTQSMTLEVGLFEVVSALGTVGLTIGGTSELDAVGKVIVMMMMFAGRVGPLTLFVMLAERRAERAPARPEGTIAVG
jgi:trk system potassium uptake protein TrkH